MISSFNHFRTVVGCSLVCSLVSLMALPEASAASASPLKGAVELSVPRFRSYVLLAAASTCVLTEKGVSYELALRSNATALFTLIRDVHGGQITGMKTNPNPDAFVRYLSYQTSATTLTVCQRFVPEAYVRLIDSTTDLLHKRKGVSSSRP